MSRPAPITNVGGKYGSPMGRRDTLHNDGEPMKLRLQYVPFVDGAYDQGGAYWGMPANLYVAWNEDGELYVRASSRDMAKQIIQGNWLGVTFYR